MILRKLVYIAIFIPAALVGMLSCSTTKRLADDEVLYTGVKKIAVNVPDSVNLPDGVNDQIKEALNVAPNNPLFSPYVRTPFPIGLWVYNNWTIDENTGKFKKWLYNMLVSEPVLISTVRPELRMRMLREILDNNGFFTSSPSYNIIYDKRNPKKARLSYNINIAEPYHMATVQLPEATSPLVMLVDSLAIESTYLKSGNVFCVDSLNQLRTDIANTLRNRGYYFFRPDFIEFEADSTVEHGLIDIRMKFADNIEEPYTRKYFTRSVTTLINRANGGGTPDSMLTKRGLVVQMKPSRLRSSLMPSCITFRKGRTFSVRDMNRTQSNLSRLGIFRSINIDVTPIDSLSEGQDSLDVFINCTFDSPLEASLELNATYKSNGYLGPGIRAGVSHSNLFGGGERLSFDLTGSYQWQIGKAGGSGSENDYYELGLTSTLSFPRLLAPRWITRSRRELNWTKIAVGVNFYNDPSSLKFLQTSAALTYQWRTNRYITNELELPKITYSKRLRNSALDDITSSADNGTNAAWDYYTHRSVFIPQISYTLTFDRSFGKGKVNAINWQTTIAEAGNLLSGIWSLCGNNDGGVGSKKLFGVPFTQYVKLQSQLVYTRKLWYQHSLVARALVGAGFIYGNADYMPYGEDFYAGGPNTIRAFGIKSLGPGSFRDLDGYNSQYLHSGSFQFIANLEYRFPIISFLRGAVFVDAGNVWLLKDPDGIYPGGVLDGSKFFDQLALGTGFGLRVDLDMLVARVDLGIGIHAPYDTGKSGYYNMTSFKNSLALNIAIGYPF